MKPLSIILTLLLSLSSLTANAQELYRTFDYATPKLDSLVAKAMPELALRIRNKQAQLMQNSQQASTILQAARHRDLKALKALKVTRPHKVDTLKLLSVIGDTIVTEEEKAELVYAILGNDPMQIATAGKHYLEEGDMLCADIVMSTLREKHPQFAYTAMLSAYISQHHALELSKSDNYIDKMNKFNELNHAASQIEQIAELAKDSVVSYRELLLTAGILRYQAEQSDACRADFDKVLSLRPSHEDSLDVQIMLAEFDQMDSLYVDARSRYELYLNTEPVLTLCRYNSEIALNYLNTLSHLAYAENRDKKSTAGYKFLNEQANRFINYDARDIRFRRYKRQANSGLALADSLNYYKHYVRSMDYVLKHEFADSLYTFDDYYEAAALAFKMKDYEANAEFLRKAIPLYEDPRVTRSVTIDYVFDRLDIALNILGRNEERAEAQALYADVKRNKLKESYEPFNDYALMGIRYFNAMKGAEGKDSDVLTYYLKADSCFRLALARTELVDSLREQQNRTVYNKFFDNNNITAINLLSGVDALTYVYEHAQKFYADKTKQYQGDSRYAQTLEDIQVYSRKMPLAMVSHVPDDNLRMQYYAQADKIYRDDFVKAGGRRISEVAEMRANLILNILKNTKGTSTRQFYVARLDSTMLNMVEYLHANPKLRDHVSEVITQHYAAYPKILGMAAQFSDSTEFRPAIVQRGDRVLAAYHKYIPDSYKLGFYRGQLYALISTSTQFDDENIVVRYTEAADKDLYLASAREQYNVLRYLMIHWYFRWESVTPKSDEDKCCVTMLRRYVDAVIEVNPDDNTALQLKSIKALWNPSYDEDVKSGAYIYKPNDAVLKEVQQGK
ncbi:MAG: hypothetical protein MJZ40_03665 [Bacteroidaceae bacterium]|nr:hypothetical protein [Bacteroidaceae bacterium]